MTLPGWLGWIATAIIVLGTVYMFYRQRKSKRDTPRSHRTYGLNGFANAIDIPIDIPEAEAWEIIEEISDIQLFVWGICLDEYVDQEEWYIDHIGFGYTEPSKKHPNIEYNTGDNDIKIKIQDSMYKHFAGEVHNVYRSFMYGPLFIDMTKNEDDRSAKIRVDALIDATNWEAE